MARIGIVADVLDTPVSGSGNYLAGVLRAMRDTDVSARHEIALIREGDAAESDVSGYGRIPMRFHRRPWPREFFRVLRTLPRIARREHLDLIHSPSQTMPVAGGRDCASVVTVLDLASTLGYSGKLRGRVLKRWAVYQAWLKYACRKAGRILTISEYAKREVARWAGIPSERIIAGLCGRGVEFHPMDARDLDRSILGGWAEQLPERFVLYVGTCEPRKNVTALVRAFAALKAEGELSHHLVLCGRQDDDFRNVWRHVTQCGLADVVHATGFVPTSDLPRLYNMADVFVFPSLYEGFGLPVLEAMGCGTPVVASNRTSLPEIVGDAGILFDPEDVPALAHAMRTLLTRSDVRADYSSRALARAGLFKWTDTAAATVRAYEEALEERRTAGRGGAE